MAQWTGAILEDDGRRRSGRRDHGDTAPRLTTRAQTAPRRACGSGRRRRASGSCGSPWRGRTASPGPADQARRLAQRIAAMSDGRFSHRRRARCRRRARRRPRRRSRPLSRQRERPPRPAPRARLFRRACRATAAIAPRHLVAWMLVGGGQALWDELAGDLGVKAMLAGPSGRSELLRGDAPHRGDERACRREGLGDGPGARRRARLRARAGHGRRRELSDAMTRGRHPRRRAGRRHRQPLPRPAGGRPLLRSAPHQQPRLGVVARHAPHAVGEPRSRRTRRSLPRPRRPRLQLALAEDEATAACSPRPPSAERTWPLAHELHRVDSLASPTPSWRKSPPPTPRAAHQCRLHGIPARWCWARTRRRSLKRRPTTMIARISLRA